ncbi:MAG: SLC13 family permease [Bacteroidales bacterium]|nr:SLC13 family permease [Bacteroidales bacterium]
MLTRNLKTPGLRILLLSVFLLLPLATFAAGSGTVPSIGSIRVEFIIFALTLVSVAVFHKRTMEVALTGLIVILAFKFIFDPSFNLIEHIAGTPEKEGEWRTLLNLLGLLFGFAILAKHFEESKVPDVLPNFLPNNWTGGLVLLVMVMILSSFLDNIAAAMIGGTMAMVLYKGKVHLGFLAAIVAASNAGGAGSVVGDTTTTLMWIDGVNPTWVFKAFIGSVAAFGIFGVVGALQQHKFNPIDANNEPGIRVDKGKLFIVFLILAGAITTNYTLDFPALGVWIAIFLGATFRKTPWHEMKNSWRGTVFLMSLVTIASVMPVDELPKASMMSSFILGFVSAVFDNIPLTKLCLVQGGYDWGVLSFAVGFGGSMIWFGSSAGVALSNMYPQAKNTVNYLSKGWHVTVAYIVGFFIMIGIAGWHPHPAHKKTEREVVTESIKE